MPFYLAENAKPLEIFHGVDAAAWVLICCLACIFLVGLLFTTIIHLQCRDSNQSTDSGSPKPGTEGGRKQFVLFEEWQAPSVWITARAQDLVFFKKAFQMTDVLILPWTEARQSCGPRELLFSPPVKGWVVITGKPLDQWTADVDHCFHLIKRLSRVLGLVQLFKVDAALGHHLWAQAMNGNILRGYAYKDEVIWNQGEMTAAEKKLHLDCPAYGSATPVFSAFPMQKNAEVIHRLASLWSVDPTVHYPLSIHHGTGTLGRCKVNRLTS